MIENQFIIFLIYEKKKKKKLFDIQRQFVISNIVFEHFSSRFEHNFKS
jgi:hypothetical protein